MCKLKQTTLYLTFCTIQHKVCMYGFCNMSFNLEPNPSYVHQTTAYIVVLNGDWTDYCWLLRAWWEDVHQAYDRIITTGYVTFWELHSSGLLCGEYFQNRSTKICTWCPVTSELWMWLIVSIKLCASSITTTLPARLMPQALRVFLCRRVL